MPSAVAGILEIVKRKRHHLEPGKVRHIGPWSWERSVRVRANACRICRISHVFPVPGGPWRMRLSGCGGRGGATGRRFHRRGLPLLAPSRWAGPTSPPGISLRARPGPSPHTACLSRCRRPASARLSSRERGAYRRASMRSACSRFHLVHQSDDVHLQDVAAHHTP